MPVIAVVNPKGGAGKSTLATNLAGHFAANGEWTALGDIDPQLSSHGWLGIRPPELAKIESWLPERHALTRPPRGIEYAILDTPAGVDAEGLKQIAGLADKLIVPLQPSLFDIYATQAFLELLAKEKAIKRRHIEVAIVGMRVDARTKSAEQLHLFVEGLGLPVVTYLRDTQNYVQLAAHGLSLWDVAPSRVDRDLEQWAALTDWARKAD